MRSLARQFGWGNARIVALESLLSQLVWIDINDRQIFENYGEIDHESLKVGLRMGQNDVWVAATARVSGMTLLTTDSDFDHLHGIWIDRIWIDPNTGNTPRVPPSRTSYNLRAIVPEGRGQGSTPQTGTDAGHDESYCPSSSSVRLTNAEQLSTASAGESLSRCASSNLRSSAASSWPGRTYSFSQARSRQRRPNSR